MSFLARFAKRYLMLRSLGPLAERATKPVLDGIKAQIHHVLIAAGLIAIGVACLIAGLTYFASSLWHALEPVLGRVGADLVLGVGYVVIAVIAVTTGLQRTRPR